MVLYRISNCDRAYDVSGTGAKLIGGRWNAIGTPIHYMVASRALAALEVLVNKNAIINTRNVCVSVFEVPDGSISIVNVADLPSDWRSYPAIPFLKQLGDEFVRQGNFLLLKVPSAVIEDEFNFLMNVDHSLASKVKVKEIMPFLFDSRLI